MMNDLRAEIILEYIRNKYQFFEEDLLRTKERIQIYDLDPSALQDFIICQTRLDTASDIFRTISELLLLFGKNNNK